jgi:arylsulfatase A-like enzyme
VQKRWPWAIAAMLFAPVAFRAAALSEAIGVVAAIDLRGWISDLGVACVAAALLVALNRVHRLLAVVWAWVWTAGHYANYELVVTLGAPATVRDLPYLLDPTFVAGSALAVSRPLLFSAALGFATFATIFGAGAERARAWVVAFAGVVACGVAFALPDSAEQPLWRQVDFLQRDAERLATAWRDSEDRSGAASAPPQAMLEHWPELAADLSGATRLGEGGRARNVLLVVLESVSGLHLETLAREQGRSPDVEMPALDALSARSLRFPSFVSQQRKTNRGLYALLCGEPPSLGDGTPKMSAAALAPWRVCLPQVLRAAGYRTVYLQAAPLPFMLKDRFMPKAGFGEVDGYDGDEPSYTRSAWGVDDRAFFEQASRRVEALRESEEPWFLALLNVGTHHPYVVPDDYRPGGRPFGRAAAYLDEAFGSFLAGLEARGALDDTLLVVTSDESLGIGGFDTEPIFKRLSQNWGLLLVRGPGVAPGVVREPFAQSDLALSLADYLELGSDGEHFFGRSVFRSYDAPRVIPFGNVNLDFVGAFEPDGRILSCSGGGSCRLYPVRDGRWFGRLGEGEPPDPAAVVSLLELARRSEPRDRHRPDTYELLQDPAVALRGDRVRMLHGGQLLHLEADEWLEVEIDLRVEAAAPVRLDWFHSLVGFRNERIFRERAVLEDGERLRLRYRYTPEGAKGQLQCRTQVRLVDGGEATLRHERARLRIRRGNRPPPGIDRLHYEREGA